MTHHSISKSCNGFSKLAVILSVFCISLLSATAQVKFSKKEKEAIARLKAEQVDVSDRGVLTSEGADWSKVKMEDLKKVAKKVTKIKISKPSAAPEDWEFLKDFVKAREVSLRHCDLKNGDLDVLPKLRALDTVRIDGNADLDQKAFETIAKCKKVRQLLAMSCPKIDDKAIAKLVVMKELQSVIVSGTGVTDEAVESLLKIKKLNFFRAELTEFSAAAEKKLKEESKNKKLRVMR